MSLNMEARLARLFCVMLAPLTVAVLTRLLQVAMTWIPTAWLSWAPGLTLAMAALLGLRFHRPRLAVGALLGATLLFFPQPGFWLLAWILPLNLVLLALLPQPDPSAPEGWFQFAGLGVQGLLLYALARPEQLQALEPLFVQLPAWGPSLLLALAALVLLWAAWVSSGPLEASLVGLTLAIASGLPHEGAVRQLWATAGGLCLLAGWLQHSYRMAYQDELTELPSRRALNETFARLRGTYAIAMLDVDHFKSFNDTYGHDVGDQVLRMVASRIRRAGGGGRAFRYGGEEFTVVFPSKTVEQAWEHLEELRRAIESNPMILRGQDRPRKKPTRPRPSDRPLKKVTITISIGVAEPSKRNCAPELVIKAADKALYKAKRNGRNQLAC